MRKNINNKSHQLKTLKASLTINCQTAFQSVVLRLHRRCQSRLRCAFFSSLTITFNVSKISLAIYSRTYTRKTPYKWWPRPLCTLFQLFFFFVHNFQCTIFVVVVLFRFFISKKKERTKKNTIKIIRRQSEPIKIGKQTQVQQVHNETLLMHALSRHQAQLFRYLFFFEANLLLDVVKRAEKTCGCIY